MTMRLKRISDSLAPHVAVLVILMFAVFPFYWAVVSTLKPTTELYTLTPTFLPITWTLDNYLWAISQDTFLLTLRNSVIVACSTAIVSVVITSMMGYSLARLRFVGKNVIVTATVCARVLLVRTIANRRSLQASTKANSATVRTPGMHSGSTTYQNAFGRVQPSVSAASSSSAGKLVKNPRNSNAENGTENVANPITSP